MDINSLHEHNREAYRKVMQHFNEGHQKACVVHATGTGKSYIIAAVADHFKNILVVAPNNYVIAQVQSTIDRNDVDYTTYQQLRRDMLKQRTYSRSYDLIVFDEFHRTGAKQWAKGVQYIMELNDKARIFGTSATPIRYLDNGRNIAEELFDGQVMSTITMQDAWVRGILISPVYIISLEDFNEVHKDMLDKINSEYIPEDKRPPLLRQLYTAQQAWEKSGGVPGVIRENISPDIKRVIVFCPEIEKIEESRNSIVEWFKQAGIRICDTYIIESSRTVKSNLDEMARFQQGGYQGVKIMISVNMLNEGVHIPRVDAIIMLRRTVSMNIYLQQMGRCMAAGDGKQRPVILDLQNNISNVGMGDWFKQSDKEYKDSIRKNNYTGEDRNITIKGLELDIINAIQSIEDEFKDYRKNFDWYTNYTEAKSFFNRHGRFVLSKENKRLHIWAVNWWVETYLKNPQLHQEKADMLTAIGFKYRTKNVLYDDLWMKSYEEAKMFFDEHGRFPSYKENENLISWARQWWKKTYLKNPELHQEKADMLTDIGFDDESVWNKLKSLWYVEYEKCREFYESNGHFPSRNENPILYDWAVRTWMYSIKRMYNIDWHKKRIQLLENIGFKYEKHSIWRVNYNECKDFYDKYGRFPTIRDNRRLRHWADNWWVKFSAGNEEKILLLRKIGYKTMDMDEYSDVRWYNCYHEAKAFFDEHGHFPSEKENKRLYSWARRWWQISYTQMPDKNEDKARMLREIEFVLNKKDGKWMLNYKSAQLFFNEFGRWPKDSENRNINLWVRSWWKNSYLKNPEMHQEKADMLTDIGFVYQSKDDISDKMFMMFYEESKVFFGEHGYFPTWKGNKKLCAWARRWWQNIYLKNPGNYQEKADMLTAIGFEYKSKK